MDTEHLGGGSLNVAGGAGKSAPPSSSFSPTASMKLTRWWAWRMTHPPRLLELDEVGEDMRGIATSSQP